MKPLLFLTYRSLVNGIRRALTSPKRLVSLVLIVGYYFWFFIRPGLVVSRQPGMDQFRIQLDHFSPAVVDAVLFGLFATMSVLLAFGIFSVKGGFKPADVDVLFPTPISPKIVLAFRIVRGYLGTLIFPLLIVLLMLPASRRGWTGLFHNANPGDSALAMKSMSLAWILMALCWVAIAYAVRLFIDRSDLKSDRNEKIIGWTLGLTILAVGIFLYFKFTQVQTARDAVAIAQHPFLRVVFFTASAATQMAMAPLTGNLFGAMLGASLMLAIIAAAIWAAMTQTNWMYDQAAAKAFSQSQTQKRVSQGDMVGEAAARAQTGKKKQYRKRWMHKVKACGPWALIWKEVFIQTRSAGGLLAILLVAGIAIGVLPFASPRDSSKGAPYFFLILQTMLVLMATLNVAMSGFIEMPRRVDLQKPLPFSPFSIVFAEVASKSIWGILVPFASCAIIVFLHPSWWGFALAVMAFSPGFSLVISATVFLITVLFPEEDDPTQVQFHRAVMLFAVVIAAAPGFGLAIGGLIVPALREWPFIPALVGGAFHVAIACILIFLASNLYATYNPSE